MKEIYTEILLFLVLVLSCICGPGLSEGIAQAGCGINLSSFNVQSEKMIDGVLHKKVQALVNNPNPGLGKKFYFLFDSNPRDGSTLYYSYGSQTDEFWVPVTTKKITFYDFNSSSCNFMYFPDLKPDICTFTVSFDIDLSEDCYHRTVNFFVDPGITIDSVAWLVNSGNTPVYDQMSWANIPPGSYEIFFFDDAGCETSTALSTCATKAYAGSDQSISYCLGEGDTVNLFDHLSPGVDTGQFYSEFFTPIDSSNVTQLTWNTPGEVRYYYIIPATLEIPDTALITVNIRDCSVCAYELVSAQRHCSDPTNVEVTIGGGRPSKGDTTFLVTLPDGSSRQAVYYKPFRVDHPSFQDTLRLSVHTDTPTGVCDSTMLIGVFPDPMVGISAQEVEMDGDSVGILLSIEQGVAPFEVDVFLDNQQRSTILMDGESIQFTFFQSSDTVVLVAMDAMGCMGIDTLFLTPDCVSPTVTSVQATCGADNGSILVDRLSMPDGSQISWENGELADVWERRDLSPGIYYYTVTYDNCILIDSLEVTAVAPINVEVSVLNHCLLDNQIEVEIRDSALVREWLYLGEVLSSFSVSMSANMDHLIIYETIDGCIDSVMVRGDEVPWLNKISYLPPSGLSAVLGPDLSSISDFGWKKGDSVLCNPCGDYLSETMIETGTYTFFAEQSPGCRRDTTIVIKQDEHYFLMPNVITPGSTRNHMIQIFDPMDQMHSIMNFQVYDRFGNILYEKHDFYPDDNSSLNWPNGMATELPDVIICVARIKCKDDEEVTMAQDVLILR